VRGVREGALELGLGCAIGCARAPPRTLFFRTCKRARGCAGCAIGVRQGARVGARLDARASDRRFLRDRGQGWATIMGKAQAIWILVDTGTIRAGNMRVKTRVVV
jgi:hypothetical protein